MMLALLLAVTLVLSGIVWMAQARSRAAAVGDAATVAPQAALASEPADAASTPTKALDAALAQLETTNQGVDFAVAVTDHVTGQSYEWGGDKPFITASVVKVEILAALLLELHQDGQGLTAQQQQLASAMIQNSDNDAADSLWLAAGGANGLAAADDAFGLHSTTPATDAWGLTTTTAADQVALLDAIAAPNGPLGTGNGTVLDLMASVDADQDWGVSAAVRPGESVELKNGWLSLDDGDGTWSINSIGRIQGGQANLTIAVLSDGQPTLDTGIAVVEQVAALARNTLDPDD
jgi:beta-lactamase class A